MFVFWVLSFIFLAWLGAKPIVRPYKNTAPFFASFYFIFFFLFFKTPIKQKTF
jgi:quinol-cytochrome oxidoreductase complex cytochrome b subunit